MGSSLPGDTIRRGMPYVRLSNQTLSDPTYNAAGVVARGVWWVLVLAANDDDTFDLPDVMPYFPESSHHQIPAAIDELLALGLVARDADGQLSVGGTHLFLRSLVPYEEVA